MCNTANDPEPHSFYATLPDRAIPRLHITTSGYQGQNGSIILYVLLYDSIYYLIKI